MLRGGHAVVLGYLAVDVQQIREDGGVIDESLVTLCHTGSASLARAAVLVRALEYEVA